VREPRQTGARDRVSGPLIYLPLWQGRKAADPGDLIVCPNDHVIGQVSRMERGETGWHRSIELLVPDYPR
jgi:hypothetical protein